MSKVAKSEAAKSGGVKAKKPVHIRGDYRLWKLPDGTYEIRKYNSETKQNDRWRAGRDLDAAEKKLDRLYLGDCICPRCGQATTGLGDESDLIVGIIDDYMTGHGDDQISASSIRVSLDHVKRYIGDKPVRVANITEAWVKDFRKWMAAEPFYRGKGGKPQFRKASTIEGSVLSLGAAIRFAKKMPLFTAKQPGKLSEPVDLRADIPLLAAMFRYCLYPEAPSEVERARKRRNRTNMLFYLRLSVATWGRPEAVLEADLTPSAKQWVSEARVFRLNPAGREQNTKYRATVPVGDWVGEWLDSLPKQPIMPNTLANATWSRMMKTLKPDAVAYEGGMKLIRRSMATLARKRLGEANWIQGKMMMGHVQPDISDTYAVADPANLGLVLAVTNEIIAEIEALVPGAFCDAQRIYSASAGNVIAMAG